MTQEGGNGSLRAAPAVNTATLAQQVHQHLREAILANRYPPGTAMLEETLATQLNVSRAPVREALRGLAAEGLVTVTARQPAVVSSLSKRDFLKGYQIREALEALAARLAVPRLSPSDLLELERLQEQMRAAATDGNVAGFFAANTAFHALIVDCSGNDKLLEMHRALVAQMRRYYLPSLYLRGGMERSIDEHQAILDAARRGDAERAACLLGEHIRVPQRVLEDEQSDLVPFAWED